jgi:hypothetical protein
MNSKRAPARTPRRSPTPIQLTLAHPARPRIVSRLSLRLALAPVRSFTRWFGASYAPLDLAMDALVPVGLDGVGAEQPYAFRALDHAMRVAELVATLEGAGLDDDFSLELDEDTPRQGAGSALPGPDRHPWASPQGAQHAVGVPQRKVPPSRKPAVAKAVAALGVATLVGCAPAPDQATPLTSWSDALVGSLEPAQNDYASEPTVVTWAGVGDAQESANRSKCASFVTAVFTQAYDRDVESWIGCTSPLAATWHDQIAMRNDFDVIDNVRDIEPGDVIAIRYDDVGCASVRCGTMQGCDSSGHMAIVRTAPVRHAASAPLIVGTREYELDIVDSTSDVHGPTDSRAGMELDGSDDAGAGVGTMRLYANASGEIVGHTWSTATQSEYRDVASRPLVIGRYAPQP